MTRYIAWSARASTAERAGPPHLAEGERLGPAVQTELHAEQALEQEDRERSEAALGALTATAG